MNNEILGKKVLYILRNQPETVPVCIFSNGFHVFAPLVSFYLHLPQKKFRRKCNSYIFQLWRKLLTGHSQLIEIRQEELSQQLVVRFIVAAEFDPEWSLNRRRIANAKFSHTSVQEKVIEMNPNNFD